MADASEVSTKNTKYIHIHGDDNFQERSTAVFSCLDSLEPAKETESKKTGRRRIQFPSQVPDHVLHPEKWTKYNLEEDGSKSCCQAVSGDVANRNIALSFLDDLRKRKASGSEGEATAGEPTVKYKKVRADHDEKIVFSKEAVKSKVELDVTKAAAELSVESQSRGKGGGRVNVMPEYVVGQNPKKTSRKRVSNTDTCCMADKAHDVGLEHLREQDEPAAESNVRPEVQQQQQQEDEMAQEKVEFAKRKSRGHVATRKHPRDEVDSTAREY